jgi:hypothetical protein
MGSPLIEADGSTGALVSLADAVTGGSVVGIGSVGGSPEVAGDVGSEVTGGSGVGVDAGGVSVVLLPFTEGIEVAPGGDTVAEVVAGGVVPDAESLGEPTVTPGELESGGSSADWQ